MARRRHSVPVRLPGDLGRQRSDGGGGPSDDEVALRLSVSRKGLGLELGRPVELGGGLRVEEVVTALFNFWINDPEELPVGHFEDIPQEGLARVVADYIAGMTDSFILEQYAQIKRTIRR